MTAVDYRDLRPVDICRKCRHRLWDDAPHYCWADEMGHLLERVAGQPGWERWPL